MKYDTNEYVSVKKDRLMNENVEQPARGSAEMNNSSLCTSASLSNLNPVQEADSPYEETYIPYVPNVSLNEKARQTSLSARVDDTRNASASSSRSVSKSGASSRGSGCGVELFAAGVGALLGVVVGLVTGGNMLLWVGIGVVVVGGIVALVRAIFAGDDHYWQYQILSELSSFWPF